MAYKRLEEHWFTWLAVKDGLMTLSHAQFEADHKAVDDLIALLVAKPRPMLADKSYDSNDVRASLLLKGILPVIPPKATRKEAIDCDYRVCKDRNRVERMFNKLKQFRRIATRYDKTAVSYPGFLALAIAKLWRPTYVNRA